MTRATTWIGVTAACLAAVASSLTTSPAAATPPEDLTIDASVVFVPAESLTWSSTGAFSDSGTIEFDETNWHAVPSPMVGAVQQTATFVGAAGTFTLRSQMLFTADGSGGFQFDGNWVVVGGTGAYEDIRGTGSIHIDLGATPSDPDLGTFTGAVHFD